MISKNYFKIGDKVRCVNNIPIKHDTNTHKLKIGKYYTINRINLSKTFIMIDDIQSWFRIGYFHSKTRRKTKKT